MLSGMLRNRRRPFASLSSKRRSLPIWAITMTDHDDDDVDLIDLHDPDDEDSDTDLDFP